MKRQEKNGPDMFSPDVLAGQKSMKDQGHNLPGCYQLDLNGEGKPYMAPALKNVEPTIGGVAVYGQQELNFDN